MTPERLFSICNMAVLPGWLLLIVAPRWKWSARLIAPVLIPGVLGLLYLVVAALELPKWGADFGSLEAVEKLFAHRWVLLAGWVHYLAFDLFIGSWEVRDSQRHGLAHWFVIPCLLLTFMFGPVGLVLYLSIRFAKTRSLVVESP